MPKYKFYLKYNPTSAPASEIEPGASNPADFTNGSDHFLWDQDWHQFYPGVSRDMAIEYDIWDHKYRRKLKGDLVFLNNQIQTDYTYLSQIAQTAVEISIRIEQTCVTSASDWWEGYFSIVDGSWDADRGLFTVNPSPDDTYRLLEEKGDVKFNLYELNPSVSIGINNGSEPYYFYTECTDLSAQEYQDTYGPPYGEWADWTLNMSQPCYAGGELDHFVHVFETIGTSVVDFGNGRGLLLKDAIDHIVSTNAGIEYKSTFLENDEFPTGHPDIPIGTKNYVTLTDPNPLSGMILMQKSNIRITSDPATKWMISFNEMADILKGMFNVDWFIDDDGYFRIEHWSYFENTASSDVDLTLLDGGKWINKKNKWSYELEDMPNRERFEFVDSYHTNFIGKDIIYNPVSTFNRYKDNIKTISLPVATDAKNLYNNRFNEGGEEGWVLLTVASDIIVNEVGVLDAEDLPNNHLSWANLHQNYWRHGRIISKGNMNGSDITFLSYQRKVKQEEITYPECCDGFDPMKFKITELGQGEVRAAEYKLIDGSVKTVFFYLDIKASGLPVPETYYILINGTNRLLWKDSDILIWYG